MTTRPAVSKNLNPICHTDGTVTFWSVYDQLWRAHAWYVPTRELAAMTELERARVRRHLAKGSGR